MVAVAFLVLHILTTILDSYVPRVGWRPSSHDLVVQASRRRYRGRGLRLDPGGVGVESDEGPYRPTIVAIHPLVQLVGRRGAIAHGFLIGTDARSGIGLAVVISCASVVVATALWRYLWRPTRSLGRTALSPLAPHQPPQPEAPRGPG